MLELRAISKSYPGVQALADVSLKFAAGEIHGVVGENGAGKSTLLKMMTGIEPPDCGEVLMEGNPVRLRSARDALQRGIVLVHQEIQLIPESTVAENVMLDKLPTRFGSSLVDWGEVNRRARVSLERVGLQLSPETVVKHLGAAQKQLIQIAKALAARARVLLLDEPTSSLTEHEARDLARILLELKAQGVALVYVSHKLDEIFALCEVVSVLRDGRHVGTRSVAELSSTELIKLMIGRESAVERLGQLKPRKGAPALRLEGLSRTGLAHDICLSVQVGEIVGLYGLVGSGRTETARLIIGDEPFDRGEIFVRGERAEIGCVQDSLHRYRIGYVSENRKEEGLFLEASVQTNITVTIWQRLRQRWTRRINAHREQQVSRDAVRSLGIKCVGPEQAAQELSGGNQQKVCMAKWLAADCDILIVDEPTVGVDVGAKEQIHGLLWDLAARQDKAILLISSDLPEIIRLSRRIYVFREKRIVGEVPDVDAPGRTYADVSQAIGRFLT